MSNISNTSKSEMLINVEIDQRQITPELSNQESIYTDDYQLKPRKVMRQLTEVRNPWFVRTFRKMGEGSLRAAIIILAVSSIGPAVYTYQIAYHNIGIIPTILMTFFIATAFLLTIDIYNHCYALHQNSPSLDILVRNAGGKLIGSIHSLAYLVVCYLSFVSALVSVNKVVFVLIGQQIFDAIGTPLDKRTFIDFNNRVLWFVAIIFFAFFIQKDTHVLQKMTFYSIGFIIIVITVIIGETPFMFAELKKNNIDIFNYYNFSFSSFFLTFSLICYDINITLNFFLVLKALKNPKRKRMNKVFFRAFGFLCILFLGVGMLSYLSLGETKVQQIDIFINRPSIWNPDTLIVFCRILCLIQFVVSAILSLFPLKLQLLSFLPNPDSQIGNIIVSLLLCYSATTFAILFPSVSKLFALAGNLGCITLSMILPCFIALRTGYTETRVQKSLIILWLIVAFFLMGIGFYCIVTD